NSDAFAYAGRSDERFQAAHLSIILDSPGLITFGTSINDRWRYLLQGVLSALEPIDSLGPSASSALELSRGTLEMDKQELWLNESRIEIAIQTLGVRPTLFLGALSMVEAGKPQNFRRD